MRLRTPAPAATLPSVLLALVTSLVVGLPAASAAVPAVVTQDVRGAEVTDHQQYGPGRLAGATPMTRGCVENVGKRVHHRKKGQACGPGRKAVEFRVTEPTQLCLMPDRTVRSIGRASCERRGGHRVRGLAGNKMLFCAVPGRALRWASKKERCVRPEKAYTLRNHHPVSLGLGGGAVDENAGRDALVGTLHTVDVDPSDVHRYSLVAGQGAQDNALFRISGDRLLARADLDHEARDTLRVRVRVRDFRRGRLTRSFTVQVRDVNEAPTGLTITSNRVAENSPVGTEVGRLRSQDPDRDDQLTYRLVGTGPDDADFAVVGDRLVTATELDHETTPTRTIRVAVSDRAGLGAEQELTVEVTDVNEAPTGLALSRDVIVENAPADTLVGSFEVVDPDAGAPYTFEVGPGDDGDDFVVRGDTLRSTRPLDHEAKAVRTVPVTVRDSEGVTFSSTVRVRVVDVNEAPTGLRLSNDEVDENVAPGTVVGLLAADDEDEGDTRTFSLVPGAGDADNGFFAVDGDRLVTRRALDHEAAATRTVRVRVTDAEGATQERIFTVTVRDLNEGPRDLVLDTDEVEENSALGTVVGTLSAMDEDDADTLTYALVPGAGDAGNDQFRIDGDELQVARPLDHETAASHSIRVRVTDAAGEQATEVVVVTVLDVNEAPSALALDHAEIPENVTGPVGGLSADDVDAGDALTFTLVSGDGDADNDEFEVVGGELRTKAGLDFEAGATLTVRVQVSDRGGLTGVEVFEVTVTDVNETPSQPALDNDEVDENAADALVGRLSATDPDAGTTLAYSLVAGAGDADNALFVVVGDELRTRGALDFEAAATRSVRVRVSDGELTAARQLTVTVNDVNDAPTAITLSPSVVEENAADTVVGVLSADDQDGDALSWALVDGDGDADNAAFVVDGDRLTTRVGLDFEAADERRVRVEAYDGTVRVQRALTVSVRDVNERPSAVALDSLTVAEETADARVGGLSATDPEGDPLTYALVAGAGDTDNALFRVDNGTLRTKAAGVDFEAGATRTVRIAASDGSLTGPGTSFIVTVLDRNDAPTGITLMPSRVRLDAEVGDVVGTLTAADVDATQVHVFTDVSVGGTHSGHGYFSVDGDRVTVARPLTGLTAGPVRLKVAVEDRWPADRTQDRTVERTLDVTLLAARRVELDTATVAENAPVGTRVGTLTYSDDLFTGTPTFAVVAGVRDAADFTVSNGRLVTARPIDFEDRTPPTRSVRVRVTAGASTFEQDLVVTVADVNEAPTALALSETTVLDSAARGDVVGTLAVTDEDATRPHLFTEVPGGDHGGLLEVTGGEVRVAGSLLGVAGDRTVKVRVTDTWGGVTHTYERLLTVTVAADSRGSLTLSGDTLPENSPEGAPVGDLSFAGVGTAPFTYAVGDAVPFSVVGAELRADESFDHETTPQRVVTVTVRDAAGRRWQREVTVTVLDVDEPPVLRDVGANLFENDPDAGFDVRFEDPEGAPVTYAFATCPGLVDENHRHTLSQHDGEAEVRRRTPLDFEDPSNSRLRVCLEASDGRLTALHRVDEGAHDVNEPTTDITLSRTVVDPTASVGTVVATLTAVDPDSRRPAITDISSTHSGAGHFEVVGDELRVARDLTAVTATELEVRLRAADSWSTLGPAVAQSYEKTLTISLRQPLVLTAPDGSVTEGLPAGTVVSSLSATGGATPYTYALDGSTADNDLFEVVGNEVRTRGPLDHVTQQRLTVRVRVTDADGRVARSSLAVTVVEANKPPTDITLSSDSVAENSGAGTVVGILSATDPSSVDSFTYSVDSTSDLRTSGNQLVTSRSFNHETTPTVSVTVTVTDGGGDTFSKAFTVRVTDVAEAPTAITLSASSVDEGLPAGAVVGDVTVADEDRGETHTFVVQGGAPFTVAGGELRTTAVLDFDDRASWTFDLTVTDKDGLTFTRSITVTVADVVQAPRAFGETVSGIVGNTRKVVTDSVLANDSDPEDKVGPQDSLSVDAGTLTTSRGGTVTMAADGTFTYDPKAGDRSVTDTVVYTVRSDVSGRTATATLRLEVGQRLVWYVDDDAQAGGAGTSHSSFNSIAAVPQLAAGEAPDEVYLADGTYGTVTIGRGRTLRGAQAGLPGLVAAVPTALAQVSVTGSTPGVVIVGGGVVDGVRMRAVGGAVLSIRGSGAVTVTEASQVQGGSLGVEIQGAAPGGDGAVGAITIGTAVTGAVTVDRNAGATTFADTVDGAVTVTGSRAPVTFAQAVNGTVAASEATAALTFDGPVTGPWVSLTNSSATTSFNGVVTLDRTGGAPAFSAVDAGTVTMSASGNTVRGPVNLERTTIGAAGLTLKSLHVASSTSGHGLRLANVQGRPFVVQGGSVAPSGGTITAATPVVSVGRASLELNGVALVSTGARAVDATDLAGPLTIARSTVTGGSGDAVSATNVVEGGAVRLDGTTVTGAGDSGVVVTAASGSVPVTVLDSTVSGSGASGVARDGVRVESLGSSHVTTTVTGSTLRDNRGDQVQVVARGSGTSRATVTGNVLARSGATGAGQGIVVNAGGTTWAGRMVVDVSSNRVQAVDGVGVVVTANAPEWTSPTGLLEARVADNVFGAAGCAGAPAVLVDVEGGTTLTATVAGNSGVVCGAPLRASGARGGSVLNLTATDNTWSGAAANLATTGVSGNASSGRTCLDVRSTAGVLTLHALGGQLTLPGHTGAWTAPAVVTHLTNRNPGSTVTVPTFLATQAGATACPQPVL